MKTKSKKKTEQFTLFGAPTTQDECPSCRKSRGFILPEGIFPLPKGAHAPLSQRPGIGPICFACNLAETLMRLGGPLNWSRARVAAHNDMMKRLRLPLHHCGTPFGRAAMPGDLDRLLDWQERTEVARGRAAMREGIVYDDPYEENGIHE